MSQSVTAAINNYECFSFFLLSVGKVFFFFFVILSGICCYFHVHWSVTSIIGIIIVRSTFNEALWRSMLLRLILHNVTTSHVTESHWWKKRKSLNSQVNFFSAASSLLVCIEIDHFFESLSCWKDCQKQDLVVQLDFNFFAGLSNYKAFELTFLSS